MSVNREVVRGQIGAKIAYFRSLRKMSQTELGKKLNMSRSSLSKIECGTYNENLSIEHLMDIADALDIDFMFLLSFSPFEREMWENVLNQKPIS